MRTVLKISYWLMLLVPLFHLQSIYAQQETAFSMALSTDSLLLGNYLTVTFKLENGQGEDFVPPAFNEFSIVSGPSISSKYSMVNGDAAYQSIAYTYQIKPAEIGAYFIASASILVNGEVLETTPREIMVLPNPEGVIQSPDGFTMEDMDMAPFDNFFPSHPPKSPSPSLKEKKTKKKRKTVKL